MKKAFGLLLLVFIAAALFGCKDDEESPQPDPIFGDWEAASDVGGETSELEIGENYEGEGTIFFYMDSTLYYADFDFSVEAKGGGEYEFDMECDGDCSDLDFTMDCEINEAGDELDCEGDGGWESYEFEWEKK